MPSNRRLTCDRLCDLRKCVSTAHPCPDASLETAVLELTRFALVMYLAPGLRGRRGVRKPAAMNTWMQKVKQLLRVARAAMTRSANADVAVLLSEDDILKATSGVPGGLVAQVLEYRERGWINTFPAFRAEGAVQGPARERGRRGAPAPVSNPVDAKEYQPFTDAFVAMAGYRCVWLINVLGPSLLALWDELVSVSSAGCYNTVRKYQTRCVLDWEWKGPNGVTISELPFALHYQDTRLRSRPDGFKPVTFGEVRTLLSILQGANLFVILLSTGSRAGEVASFEKDCLIPAEDGAFRAGGKTYKFVFENQGADRDWPLPDLAVAALLLQQRIAAVVKSSFDVGPAIRPEALWVPFSSSQSQIALEHGLESFPSFSVHGTIGSFVDRIGADAREVGSAHPHRFRKTLARLIALAIAHSPQVVMDLFGHKTIEMSLRYIRTDKALRAEILRVAQELRVVLASDVLEAKDAGGRGATLVADAISARSARRGETELQTGDLAELAQLFALSDSALQLVRPGVVCMKAPHQPGPCTKRTGQPDPSRCRSGCESRVELAFLRDDVEGAIAEAIAGIESAAAAEDQLLAEWWRGQLLVQLPRFDDIRAKWSGHPEVLRAAARKKPAKDVA